MTVSEKGSCVEDEQDGGRGGGVKGLATRVGFGHAREPHAVISALAATTTQFSILLHLRGDRRVHPSYLVSWFWCAKPQTLHQEWLVVATAVSSVDNAYSPEIRSGLFLPFPGASDVPFMPAMESDVMLASKRANRLPSNLFLLQPSLCSLAMKRYLSIRYPALTT